jgi:serine/threonine-protein kinase
VEPGAVERRLVAILSADAVGYSRLMAEDEAQTVRTIGHYREEVRLLVGQHRGRVVDFTGDNVLAEFPTATNAVECAVEVQRVVQARNAGLPPQRRMHFRIGIHLGEVTLEGDRLYGDGVNIAARLEGLAPPGGICVSAAVREQVKRSSALIFEDMGSRDLKNIPDPVRISRVRLDTEVKGPPAARARVSTVAASLVIAGAGIVALLLAAWMMLGSPTPEPGAALHFRLGVLGNGRLSEGSFPPVAVSRDGRNIAYAAVVGDTSQIFLRSLDRFEAIPLAGTESAVSPFFSPDGSWIGFFAHGTLRKIRTTGGAPVVICETSNFSFPSANWGTDGVVRFSRGINVSGGMLRVPENGGTPERLTTPDFANGERWHGLPQLLPGGELLFTVATSKGFRAAILSRESEERMILEELGPAVGARYQTSGHITFGQPGRLMAIPWSRPERAGGTPTSVLEGVHTSRLGIPYFAVSESGTLVYAPGGIVQTTPVLLDREGRATPLTDDPGAFQHPRFSPDGGQLAMDVTWRGRTDIYVYDLERGTRRRLTHTGFNIDPLWTVDGSGIIFRSTRRDSVGQDLYRVPSDGNGEAELFLESVQDKVPGSWARDGSLLVYTDISPSTRAMDVGLLDVASGSVEPFLTSPYNAGWPVFSPDGGRLAYVSDETGRTEVWVRSFPGTGAAMQVSIEGGYEPVWSPDGKELFFRRGTSFFSVDFEGEAGLRAGSPYEMFRGRYDLSPTGHQHFDIDPEGRRFAAIALGQAADPDSLHLVLDWPRELDELVPGRR